MAYEEEEEEISPDLWQEACWIVIRLDRSLGGRGVHPVDMIHMGMPWLASGLDLELVGFVDLGFLPFDH